MKNIIFKYSIPLTGEIITLDLPEGFSICEIAEQDNAICIWALIDNNQPLKKYRFVLIGTGWDIPNIQTLHFLKTVPMKSGLVWHVFCFNEDFLVKIEKKDAITK